MSDLRCTCNPMGWDREDDCPLHGAAPQTGKGSIVHAEKAARESDVRGCGAPQRSSSTWRLVRCPRCMEESHHAVDDPRLCSVCGSVMEPVALTGKGLRDV